MAHDDHLSAEVRRVVDILDRLLADRSQGRPSHARHDEHVEQVEEAAARLRQAVRGPVRPLYPPLAILADGTHVW